MIEFCRPTFRQSLHRHEHWIR